MFEPFVPLDRCVGKEVKARAGDVTYTGILAGVYNLSGVPVLVLTPMQEPGVEYHVPLLGTVVMVQQ